MARPEGKEGRPQTPQPMPEPQPPVRTMALTRRGAVTTGAGAPPLPADTGPPLTMEYGMPPPMCCVGVLEGQRPEMAPELNVALRPITKALMVMHTLPSDRSPGALVGSGVPYIEHRY